MSGGSSMSCQSFGRLGSSCSVASVSNTGSDLSIFKANESLSVKLADVCGTSAIVTSANVLQYTLTVTLATSLLLAVILCVDCSPNSRMDECRRLLWSEG